MTDCQGRMCKGFYGLLALDSDQEIYRRRTYFLSLELSNDGFLDDTKGV
jgi:hypothetical protein